MDSKQAMNLALEALEEIHPGNMTPIAEEAWKKAITALREALAEQPAQQEPVAFLANGTRFKISYDSRQSGGQIHGIPPELGGRWVAFVAADDDCHLKLTSPPASKPWVGLEPGEISKIATSDPLAWANLNTVENRQYFARAIEAKLKENNT